MYSTKSKDPLAKKFICKYCGKAFRTRQGISGHIQFKHSTGKETQQIDNTYVSPKIKDVALFGAAWGLSKSAIKARQMVLADWLEVQALCKFLDINVNVQDFKYYLIRRLAQLKDKGNAD